MARALENYRQPKSEQKTMATMCHEEGVGKNYIQTALIKPALALAPEDTPFAPKERSDKGIHWLYTEDILAACAEQAKTWNYEFSDRELAEWLVEAGHLEHSSGTALAEALKDAGWTKKRSRAKPTLQEHHRTARVEFCEQYQDEEFYQWVDVDEKWFYVQRTHATKRLPEGVECPHETVQHKSHVPKVMFLTAIARPKKGQHDGKVGIWRIAESKKWEKKSTSKHTQGEWYDDAVSMNCDRYFEFMTKKVFPKIRTDFARSTKTIIVQQDGARPHTGKDMVNKLNKEGAFGFPQIKVVTQPAQSPDLNICDLAFFSALAMAVRKIRRGKRSFDIEQLVDDVKEALDAYPSERLEKMWQTKQRAMRRIIECDGWNNYNLHRTAEEKAADRAKQAKRK